MRAMGAGVGKLYLSQYQKFSPVCSVNLKSVRSDEVQHGSQFYWWRKPEYPEKTTIYIYKMYIHIHL
jgi:hypothetical protein